MVQPGTIPFVGGQPTLVRDLGDDLLKSGSGQIIGPHGSGKSTLVHSIIDSLVGQYVVLRRLCFVAPMKRDWLGNLHHRRLLSAELRGQIRAMRWEIMGKQSLLIIDGAEQLSWWAYRQVIRFANRHDLRLLVTSHQSLPGLPVIYRCETSIPIIKHITRQRISDSSDVVRGIVETDLNHRNFSGLSNVRDYWFELYDAVQPSLQSIDRKQYPEVKLTNKLEDRLVDG